MMYARTTSCIEKMPRRAAEVTWRVALFHLRTWKTTARAAPQVKTAANSVALVMSEAAALDERGASPKKPRGSFAATLAATFASRQSPTVAICQTAMPSRRKLQRSR
eukprot:Amastigsp_a841091_7993.p4 type:complete len:107 gc:universal Amastigsp_a841091_7993:397-77(-)